MTKDGAAQRAATAEMNASSRNRTLLLLLAGVALSLVLAGLVARSVRRPTAGMVEALNTVADGDLTRDVDVHASAEVGQTAEALRRALRSVRATVSDTEQASAELARLSRELSRLVGQFRYE
ncbi:MAG: HAMP domain-containing protein [Mycobacterium leprae]